MCIERDVQFYNSDFHKPYLMRYNISVTVTRLQARRRRVGIRFSVTAYICLLYRVLTCSGAHNVSYAMPTKVLSQSGRSAAGVMYTTDWTNYR